MNSVGHLPVAAATSVTVSWALELPMWQRIPSALLAVMVAMVPDSDNTKPWKKIAGKMPGVWANHRRITHMWLIPALIYYLDHSWVMIAIVTGIASHVGADLLFGEGGVPMFLWHLRFGLHLPMGGVLELIVGFTVGAYAICALLLGPNGPALMAEGAQVFVQVLFS